MSVSQKNTKVNILIYGLHSVISACENKKRKIYEINATAEAIKKIPSSVAKKTKIREVSLGHINNTLKLKNYNHQGIAALCSEREVWIYRKNLTKI